MTINEKVEIFFKQVIASMANAIQAVNTEEQIVLMYLRAISVLRTICGAKIPDQSEVDELAFIKLNEQTSDQIWDIFKQNLERVGSDLIYDSRFDLLNPANIFRDRNIGAKIFYMMEPAEMVQ
jgi:hypothetical protein